MTQRAPKTDRATVLPVVHHHHGTLTLDQAELALACGADGVFLISHGVHLDGRDGDDEILDVATELVAKHGPSKIGVNLLSRPFGIAFEDAVRAGVGMIWTDDPGIRGPQVSPDARTVAATLAASGGPAVFASVAFKYQPVDTQPGEAARTAAGLGFIPTTSGDRTGTPPDPSKIVKMRVALGLAKPLAIASGLSPSNVHLYTANDEGPLATHLLVSTAISLDAHRFDEGALKAFLAASRARSAGIEVREIAGERDG